MSRVIAFVFVVILFGSNFPVIRILNRSIPPFYGAALRFSISALVLSIIVVAAKIAWPKGKSLHAAIAYGAIAYGGTFGCLFIAIKLAGAGLVAVLFATAPLFTALIASMFGVEKLTLRKLLGTGGALVGSAWIYWRNLSLDLPPLAFVLTLAGAAGAGLSTVILKRAPRTHPLGTNAVACAVGGVVLFVIAASFGAIDNEHWSMSAVLALGWLSIVGTVVGFTLVAWLILHWSPTKLNYQSVLSPLVAAVLAYLLLDEPIKTDLVIGAIAILAGGWAVLLEASSAQAQAQKAPR